MNVPEGKKIYFSSDNHLGAPTPEASKPREEKFVRWLEEVRQDAAAIFRALDNDVRCLPTPLQNGSTAGFIPTWECPWHNISLLKTKPFQEKKMWNSWARRRNGLSSTADANSKAGTTTILSSDTGTCPWRSS